MSKTAIIILGKPGSGKGTQAKLLAEKLGFFYFLTSAIGREYIAGRNDPESREQVARAEKGRLWESAWILRVVEEKTKEIFSRTQGLVYDGFPRDLYEAERFLPFVIQLFGRENVKIVELEVSDGEVMKRIEKRLTCSKNSQHVFIESKGLRPGTACPEGDGILEERIDDTQERLKIRLEEYGRETASAIEFLKKNYKVLTINGEGAIKDIHSNILKTLGYDNH